MLKLTNHAYACKSVMPELIIGAALATVVLAHNTSDPSP